MANMIPPSWMNYYTVLVTNALYTARSFNTFSSSSSSAHFARCNRQHWQLQTFLAKPLTPGTCIFSPPTSNGSSTSLIRPSASLCSGLVHPSRVESHCLCSSPFYPLKKYPSQDLFLLLVNFFNKLLHHLTKLCRLTSVSLLASLSKTKKKLEIYDFSRFRASLRAENGT